MFSDWNQLVYIKEIHTASANAIKSLSSYQTQSVALETLIQSCVLSLLIIDYQYLFYLLKKNTYAKATANKRAKTAKTFIVLSQNVAYNPQRPFIKIIENVQYNYEIINFSFTRITFIFSEVLLLFCGMHMHNLLTLQAEIR